MEGTSSKKESKVKVYLHRYFIDAMSAMAQGLFASLLIGTIISTLGTQLNIPLLDEIGGYAKSAAGPAMAVAIGYALQAPPLVLFSLVAVGGAANALGGAGGPLAVLVLAIIAAEFGKLVSKKTKVDIIVTPLVTIFSGCGLAYLFAPYIGTAASSVGHLTQRSNHPAAVPHGHSRFRHRRRCIDAADLQRGHLRSARFNGPCGRRGRCRLLCADDRLCGHQLPR